MPDPRMTTKTTTKTTTATFFVQLVGAIIVLFSSCDGFRQRSAYQYRYRYYSTTRNGRIRSHNHRRRRRCGHHHTRLGQVATTASIPLEGKSGGIDPIDPIDPMASLETERMSSSSSSSSSGDLGGEVPTKVGVLLLNLGGPETSDDVEGFLFNLFADPDIIRLPLLLSPLQPLIAWIISKRRAPKSRAAYESIGGGSPILQYSNAQADLLRQSLKRRYDLDVSTYIGMRYWYPFTEEALAKIQNDHVAALVIIPLYPQFSISTSGSSLRVLQEEFAKHSDLYGPQRMVHTVVPSWYHRPGYVQTMAKLIRAELESFTPEEIDEAKKNAPDGTTDGDDCPLHVLFSAHGVPQSYIDAGDPYQRQIEECVEQISAALPGPDHGVKVHLSYQSRVGPIEWLRPYTDDVLPQLGNTGVKNLVVVPISFVSEHIETLEEIDIEYRELALASGIDNWRRCPALNTDPTFIEDLADMVVEALSEPVQTVTETCVANNCGDVLLKTIDERVGSIASTAGVGGVGADADLVKRQQQQQQLQDKERINGRVAMLGVTVTVLIEILSGNSLTHMLGFGSSV